MCIVWKFAFLIDLKALNDNFQIQPWNIAKMRTHVDGGGRGVKFSGILCGRHKCMLPIGAYRKYIL